MPRAAGNDSHYQWVLKRKDTGEYDEANTIELPSVTTIIKATLASPVLVSWAYRQTLVGIDILHDHGLLDPEEHDLDALLAQERLRPDDLKEDGARRGTDAHAYLESLAETQLGEGVDAANARVLETLTENEDPFRLAIARWWRDTQPLIVASEQILRSLVHGYSGTCDLVYKRMPQLGPGICDLKTRKADSGCYRDDKLQVAAYQLMWNEMYPDQEVRWKTVLVAMDDGKYAEHRSAVEPDTFLKLFDCYKALKGL